MHRAAVPLLIAASLAIAAASVTWKAWDMFGPSRRLMLQGWNDSFYYFWLPAVVIDHDVDFASLLAHSGTVTAEARLSGLALERTRTGLLPNKYPPGWAIGSLPFFLAARAVSPAASTGFEPAYMIAVWLGQMLYAGFGLWLAHRVVRRLVPGAPSGLAVLAVWLASPMVYYQTARVSLSHSQAFTLAMAVFWLALQAAGGDRRRCVWLSLGFCGALLVVTRNICAVYLVLPAALLAGELRSWRTLAWLALGAAGPAAAQVAAWKILFGTWIAYSYGTERFDFTHPHLYDVLFSPRHGWFYWHPLLLVGLIGFLWRPPGRLVAACGLVSVCAIILLNAAWPCWWFASSFGNRGFEVATFFAMVGVAALMREAQSRPAWRRVLAGAVSAAVAWNILLLGLFLTRRIPNEEAVTFGDSARALAAWLASMGR